MEPTKISYKSRLIDYGFKEYEQRFEWPITKKELFQRRFTNQRVCERNGNIFINVLAVAIKDEAPTFEISLTAEHNSVWWDLKAYGLSEEELDQKLPIIEATLVNLFNQI